MLIYLLKSGACLAIFMIFYRFFLENENMHVFKRYYLLGALILAFSIPLTTFTQYIEVSPIPSVIESFEPVVFYTENVSQTEEINYVPLILWNIYALGVLVFGLLFIKNLIQIIFKIKRNPKQKSKHVIHVLLSDLVTPHTFLKYIFLNKQKFEKHEIPQEVFWHEETHAKQKHSLDVLFIEFLQVIFWFNPLIYFAKYAIKMNHEFLADQAVLNKGISLPTYQHILLAFSSNASESTLANAINYSSTRRATSVIKKRFTVMKTHTTKRKILLRSLVLLPLFALTLYGFSEKKEVVKPLTNQTVSTDIIQDNLIPSDEMKTQLKSNKISSEIIEQESPYEILLNTKGKFLVNDDLGTLKEIENDFKAIAADKTKSKTIVFRYDSDAPQKAIDQVMDLVKKYNLKTIERAPEESSPEEVAEYNRILTGLNAKPEKDRIISQKDLNRIESIYNRMTDEQKSNAEVFPNLPNKPPNPPLIKEKQQKATPQEVAEYNTLAKYYNDQSEHSYVLKLKDMKRVNEIYKKMDESQKSKAEPLPNFPPPPPPVPPNPESYRIQTLLPPPPPPSANLSAEQKKVYMQSLNNTNEKVSYIYKNETKEGKDSYIVVISDRDETAVRSKAVLDHVTDMKKKGAQFFYNNKAISGDQALNYIKTVKELYISTQQMDTKQPKVYISNTFIPSKD